MLPLRLKLFTSTARRGASGRARFASSEADVPAVRAQLCRSVLYVPGDNQKALAKSALLPIDTVLIDLEDGAKDKKAARAGALFALKNVDFGSRQVVLRVNGRGTGLGRLDMMTLFSDADALRRIDAVAIPKAESRLDIDEIAEGLNDATSRRDVLNGQPMPIWAVIETAAGVLGCHELCRAAAAPSNHNGVACKLSALVAGTSDLTKDLRARHTQDRAPMLASLSHIVLAARASGLLALDGVFLDLRKSTETTATFERHCQQGRDLGFDGKTLIHPSQVEACNRAFSPSPEDVAWARKVVEAAAAQEAATTRSSGDSVLVLVDGQLIERLHVAEAHRVLQLHDAIESRAAALPLAGAGASKA